MNENSNNEAKKENMLAMIETMHPMVLAKYLIGMENCSDSLKSYLKDREKDFLEESGEIQYDNELEKIFLKAFRSKKLSPKDEINLYASAYVWNELRDDEDVKEAVLNKIKELEYNVDDEYSKAETVMACSAFIYKIKGWDDINEEIASKVSQFDFADFMAFLQTCGNYYILRNDTFNKILVDKLKDFSDSEYYYYLYQSQDGADGNSPEIMEIKSKKISESKFKELKKLFEKTFGKIESDSSEQKFNIEDIVEMRFDAHTNYEWHKLDEETRNQKIIESYKYKEYLNKLKDLPSTDFVPFLIINDYRDTTNILPPEEEILKNKLEELSKEGLRVVASYYLENNRELPKQSFWKNCLIDKGVITINEDESLSLNGTQEEIETATKSAKVYEKIFNNKKSIPIEYVSNIDFLENEEDVIIEDNIEDAVLDTYKQNRKQILNNLNFIDLIRSFENYSDMDVIRTINGATNLIEVESDDNNIKFKRGNYIVNYLAKRVIGMHPYMVSLVNLKNDGLLNDAVLIGIEQAKFGSISPSVEDVEM